MLCSNCLKYNHEGSSVCEDVEKLLAHTRKRANAMRRHDQNAKLRKDISSAFGAVRKAEDKAQRPLASEFLKLPSRSAYPDYYKVIKRPMDLNNIQVRVKNNAYKTWDDFQQDMRLIWANACQYNLPDSQIVRDALALKRGFQLHIKAVAAAATIDARLVPAQQPPQSRLGPASLKATGLRVIAKRERPKSELSEKMARTLTRILECRDGVRQRAQMFLQLPSRAAMPEYYDVIQQPMDLETVRRKLDTGKYRSFDGFAADVALVFNNAVTYNQSGSQIFIDAEMLTFILHTDVAREKGLSGKTAKKRRRVPEPPRGVRGEARRMWQAWASVAYHEGELIGGLQHDSDDSDLFEAPRRKIAAILMDLPSLQHFPDYYRKVKKPLDLETVKLRVEGGAYPQMADFERDMLLVPRRDAAHEQD